MYEKEFIIYFIQQLEEIGFPRNSIAIEYGVQNASSKGIIDIAIIEPLTNKVLMIFEIKILRDNRPPKQLLEMAQKQLLNYINLLGNTKIPAYVILVKNVKDFEIYPFELDDNDIRRLLPAIPLNSLSPYTALSNGSRANAIQSASKEIKKTTDWFKIICWISATLSVGLAILDNLQYIAISNIQLALIGVAIALVIMPFSKKLKILGVEFERLVAEKKEKTK